MATLELSCLLLKQQVVTSTGCVIKDVHLACLEVRPAEVPTGCLVAMGAAGRGGNSMLGTDYERRCYYLISHRSHGRLREVK